MPLETNTNTTETVPMAPPEQRIITPSMNLTRRQSLLSIGIGLALGTVVALAALAAYFAYSNYQRVFVDTSAPTTQNASATPEPTPDPLAPFGVLVMGFGGGGHDGGFLTDTMIVALVEPKLERVSLISLPRDLWVEIPTSETTKQGFKVNAAYAIGRDDRRYPNKPEAYKGEGGGGALAKQIVSDVTGLPVKYFAVLSFRGFEKSIDVLGGVPIRVPVTFDDPFYPIEENKNDTCGISEEELAARTATISGQKLEQSFPCRYENLHFDAGTQTMDGATALKYVRSRHSPQSGGDAARAARQRSLISGVKDHVFKVQFLSKAIPFLSSLTTDMQMDVDLPTLQKWLSEAETYRNYSIQSIEVSEKTILQLGTSADRQSILQPRSGMFDWVSVHAYIENELARTATESAQPAASSSARTH